ncbi:MAG: MarR family transcriptional regulator [Eubacterium sp.]
MKKEKKSKKPDVKKTAKKKSPKKKEDLIVENKPQKVAASTKKDHLNEQITTLLAKYQAIEATPRFYGGNIPLYISESNTLRIIGDHPAINLTKIAESLEVSKSAISKSSGKLLEKGLITKERSVREVLFNLTELGQEVYSRMDSDDDLVFSGVKTFLSTLDKNDRQTIEGFFAGLTKALDESINRLEEPLVAIDEKE